MKAPRASESQKGVSALVRYGRNRTPREPGGTVAARSLSRDSMWPSFGSMPERRSRNHAMHRPPELRSASRVYPPAIGLDRVRNAREYRYSSEWTPIVIEVPRLR